MTNVLTYKIPIIKPISTEWKVFGEIGGDLIYNAIKIMNEAMREHYLFIQERYKYEEETGRKMNVKDVYGVSTYTTIINRSIKERNKDANIPGDIVERIIRQAIDTFNTKARDVLAGNASLPSFRRDQPIPVRARSLRLSEDYTVLLPFMTRDLAKSYGFSGRNMQSFEVQLGTKGGAKIVLDRILSGEYRAADSKVQRTLDGKWYLLLSYHQPKRDVKRDKSVIMGIDLGVTNAATIAISNRRKVEVIRGGEITAFRNRINGRRKSMQNQLKVCSHNRRGHGKKTLLKPTDVISNKIENFKNTVNHRYSKYIIDLALKNGVGVIQMEDLSGINKRDSFLSTWSYFDLQTKIEYKAKMQGIEVRKIKPAYTSQRCNKCGVIDKESRQTQATFNCTTCGHKRNADFNAAENIAMDGIEKIIEEQLKMQKE